MSRRHPRRIARHLAASLAVLGASWISPLAALPGDPGDRSKDPHQASDEVGEEPQEQKREQKATAWPKVDSASVKVEVERLRKARTEEMGVEARAALVAIGPGVAPYLIDKLPHEHDAQALGRMRAVLDEVTGSSHTRLFAERFTDKALLIRIWCLKRAALFPDSGLATAAEKALAAAKGRKRKVDPTEVYVAALCCASAGSFAGFQDLATAAEEDWSGRLDELVTALGVLRGPEATALVAPLLAESARKRKLTGLRLLATCGDPETAAALVKPFLDHTDNSLRVGAINALRGIVDGDPPLKRLPVFEAIERANKWKARL
jgi:hypothetical protein